MELQMLLFSLLVLNVFSMAGAQVAGWINIDCGATSNYTDPVTGIQWVTDTGYVSTGANVEVPNVLQYYPGFAELTTVRVFNNSRAKNCYTLAPVIPNNTYIIRGSFLYALYDGAATSSLLPTFQVAIETTVVANVTFIAQNGLRVLEHTLMAKNDTIHYCLVQDQSLSNPFVSAIVVRKLDQAVADVWFNSSNPSELSRGFIFRARGRADFGGSPNEFIRYPVDPLDRYWFGAGNTSPYVNQNRIPIKNLSAPALAGKLNNIYSNKVPGVVLSTALSPTTISNFTIVLPIVTQSYLAWLNIYFVELDLTAKTSSARRFGVNLYGSRFYDAIVDLDNPQQGGGLAAFIYRNFVYTSTTKITLYPINPTKRPPLVNALEWYQVINETVAPTESGEVLTIETIKLKLNLSDWVGDPCLPSPYDWLTCSIVSITSNPQILKLNLSSYGVVGSIPPQISQLQNITSLALDHNALTGPIPDLSALTSLETLDLQNNSLSGPIPDWLASMPSLTELFLQNNNFSGKIPAALLNKTGSNFTFMYGGNPNLITGLINGTQTAAGKSSTKSKTAIIIGAVIGGTGVLVLIVLLCITGVCLCLRKKEKATGIQGPIDNGSHGNGTTLEGATKVDVPGHPTSELVD